MNESPATSPADTLVRGPKSGLDDPDTIVRFDTKIVVLLDEGLAAWQELNVTAFLVSGITVSAPGLTGEPYRDGDGIHYLPMLRQPVLIMSASADLLRAVRAKSSSRDDTVAAVYTRELFATGHDAANRAAVAAVGSDDLDLVGIAIRGPRNAVDRMTKGARLHD
ncbi:DUF2000 domain-containing protein [Microbacterium sp. 1.5R]|uniref:DUF2000 domain-containing protein n=1 Tax=Microbacterium sp. 1.5R TaxID=1916917 RepID=UPI0011A52E41|nr:DUF2000 domain-containing protein [Microbacterium sp. 1.5R]